MPILLLALGYFFPRIVILVLYFLTSWFSAAFDGILLPLLGFLFMPISLLAYGIVSYFYGAAWSGVPLIIMVVAIALDLGLIGRGAKR